MELISSSSNINFLRLSPIALVLSLIAVVLSFVLWFQKGEEKYGVDYKGGHEIIVSIPQGNTDSLRSSLTKAEISGAIVQEFESGSDEFSIRMSGDFEAASSIKQKVSQAIKSLNQNSEVMASNFIGPTIGAELRRNALIAIVISLIGMLAYITYRFEFAFALGSVFALFHDVVICLGIYLICGKTLTMATLAAALTIVGYSVNDTIIVFDRIREEIMKRKSFILEEVINFSINATLSRTVITSLLTLFSAIALLVFGGGAIQDLALFLVVGVITGTYSTIFIASPIALFWEKRMSKEEED